MHSPADECGLQNKEGANNESAKLNKNGISEDAVHQFVTSRLFMSRYNLVRYPAKMDSTLGKISHPSHSYRFELVLLGPLPIPSKF